MFIKDCGRPGCSATSRSRTSESPYTEHSWPGGGSTGISCVAMVPLFRGIVCRYGSYFEPRQVIRIHRGLDDDAEVHEVAEVQHEEVILLSVVILEPAQWEMWDGR